MLGVEKLSSIFSLPPAKRVYQKIKKSASEKNQYTDASILQWRCVLVVCLCVHYTSTNARLGNTKAKTTPTKIVKAQSGGVHHF